MWAVKIIKPIANDLMYQTGYENAEATLAWSFLSLLHCLKPLQKGDWYLTTAHGVSMNSDTEKNTV